MLIANVVSEENAATLVFAIRVANWQFASLLIQEFRDTAKMHLLACCAGLLANIRGFPYARYVPAA